MASRRLALLPLALALAVASCGGVDGSESAGDTGDAERRACMPVEELTETSSGHALPGAEPFYAHHPPASGVHLPPGPEPGVHTEPISEPEQVAALETGKVVLQYGPEASRAARAALEMVAGELDDVVVAPAAGTIDGDLPIAFTAWEHRQRCDDAVTADDARAFARDFLGRASDDAGHEGG